MHETSLIEFTLNAVERRAKELNMEEVKVIHLTIGAIRGAIPALMQEAFRIMIYNRPMFHDAELEITDKPTVVRCSDCGHEFEIMDFHNITCPSCGGRKYTVVSGDELRIDYFEG